MTTQVADALELARQLDRERPAADKLWITAFGSYEKTTKTILYGMNLAPL